MNFTVFSRASWREEVAGGVEMEEAHAELEALGPLGPAAGGIFPGDGEDGRALGGIPRGVDGADFLAGEFKNARGFLVRRCGVSVALIFIK